MSLLSKQLITWTKKYNDTINYIFNLKTLLEILEKIYQIVWQKLGKNGWI